MRPIHEIALPDEVSFIIGRLRECFHTAYAVGGCIRDSLLGLTPKDWDVCTSAVPDEVKRCFKGFRFLDTGIKHGTVTLMLDNGMYEITTYRVESGYSDNRHPDRVDFTDNISADLARRDFTVNAMAYSPDTGLIDLYGGTEDLRQGIIRCVGDANKRFEEDALRILRALRFASGYEMRIDEATAAGIHGNKHRLKFVSAERINSEFNGLLMGNGVRRILNDYSDVIFTFIPELSLSEGFSQKNKYHLYDVWQHTVRSLGYAPNDLIIKLTMLFHDAGKPLCCKPDSDGTTHFKGHAEKSAEIAVEVLKRLRYPNDTIYKVRDLIAAHELRPTYEQTEVKKYLRVYSEAMLRRLITVCVCDNMAKNTAVTQVDINQFMVMTSMIDNVVYQNDCTDIKHLAVNGHDLIGAGVPQGKAVGSELNALLNMVINGQIENNRESLLKVIDSKYNK